MASRRTHRQPDAGEAQRRLVAQAIVGQFDNIAGSRSAQRLGERWCVAVARRHVHHPPRHRVSREARGRRRLGQHRIGRCLARTDRTPRRRRSPPQAADDRRQPGERQQPGQGRRRLRPAVAHRLDGGHHARPRGRHIDLLVFGDPQQLGDQFRRPLEAVGGILGHEPGDGGGEPSRHVGPQGLDGRRRLLLMRQQFLHHGAVGEWWPADEHEEDGAAQ